MLKKEPKYVTEEKLDEVLDKRFSKFEKRIVTQFEIQFAIFFGKLDAYFDKRFNEMEERLNKRYDPLLSVADATQKRMDNVEHETLALSDQVDRHEVWIHCVSDTAARST